MEQLSTDCSECGGAWGWPRVWAGGGHVKNPGVKTDSLRRKGGGVGGGFFTRIIDCSQAGGGGLGVQSTNTSTGGNISCLQHLH